MILIFLLSVSSLPLLIDFIAAAFHFRSQILLICYVLMTIRGRCAQKPKNIAKIHFPAWICDVKFTSCAILTGR